MKVVCSQSELNAALQLVSRAVATRPTHPVLANVLLTADAGTDRLSLTGFDLNLGIQTSLAASVETSGAITLPARSLREVERLMAGWRSDDPVSLFCDRGQVVFLAADQMVTSRTLEGTYPNYRQLIPDGFNRSLAMDRRALVAALERIAVLADQHNNVVKFSSQPDDGVVLISADAQDVGSGSESLAAELSGDAIQIAFNVRYLLDGLKAMAVDRIVLHCNAPTTPAVLRPQQEEQDGFTYLVMPVQIRS